MRSGDGLRQVLEELKRVGALLERQEKRIEAIEQKLKTVGTRRDPSGEQIPPALLRVLKTLSELRSWVSAEELARKVNLSRNLISGYLSRLREKGYIERSPNMDSSKLVRFVFKADPDRLPEEVRRLVLKGSTRASTI